MTTYNAEITIINDQLSRKKEAWMNRAIGVAYRSNCTQRLGAVIVKSNSLLSTGVNSLRNTPDDLYLGDISVHAEMAALRALRGHDNKYSAAKGATIYIARLLRDDTTAMARPCDNCYENLVAAGVSTIIYTTNDPNGAHIAG